MANRYLHLTIMRNGALMSSPVVREADLERGVVLGRGATVADLPDAKVSRNQAEIRMDGGGLLLTHQGKNPTRVVANARGAPITLDGQGDSVKLGARFTLALGPFQVDGQFEDMGDTVTDEGTRPAPPPVALVRSASGRRAESTDAPIVVHRSRVMAETLRQAQAVARSECNVLILGESGSGKDVLARVVHASSPRRQGSWVARSVVEIPIDGNLGELELFGRVPDYPAKGDGGMPGLFEQANGGTLFLDEIGDLPPKLQAAFLRAIEARRVTRMGADRTRNDHSKFCEIPLDVRLVLATHRNLPEKIARGEFREDLYYRIREAVIEVPPLRVRAEDIPALVEHFLATECPTGRTGPLALSPLVTEVLERYRWPGNVRQLRAEIRRLYAMLPDDPLALVTDLADEVVLGLAADSGSYHRHYIAWKRHGRDYKAACAELGFTEHSALYKGIERVLGHSVREINQLEPNARL